MMRRSPADAQAAHAEPARARGRRVQLHRPWAHMLRVRERGTCDVVSGPTVDAKYGNVPIQRPDEALSVQGPAAACGRPATSGGIADE